MSTQLTELKNLFQGQPLSLSGGGRTPANGTAYTKAEIEAVTFFCRLVLTVTENECNEPVTELEMQQNQAYVDVFKTANELNNNFSDVAHAIRATYKMYEGYQLSNPNTLGDFPKVDARGDRVARNQSSLNVLFRKCMKNLVSKEFRDRIFKPQHKKTSEEEDA